MEQIISQIWQLLELKKQIQFSDYINAERLKPISISLRQHLKLQKLSQQDVFEYLMKVLIKCINLSSKDLTQVWKAIIYTNIQNIDQQFTLANNFSVTLLSNLIKKYNPSPKKLSNSQIEHFMQLWKICVKFSDYKLLHYILIALYFNLHVFFYLQSFQNISKKQRKENQLTDNYEINIIILLIIKYCDKINDKQIIELIILIVQKMSFHLVAILSQKNKSFVINAAVQNLYICEFVYLSKLSKFTQKQATRMFNLLTMLNQVNYFQRLINAKIKEKFVWLFQSTLKPRRLQSICFCSFVNTLLALCTLQNSNAGVFLQKCILQLIQVLVKRQLTINMVKFLTKKLQIVNDAFPSKKWKVITKLMSELLHQYHKPRNIVQFQQKNSYISKKLNNVQFPFSIQLELKGESLPFKEQKILLQLCQNSKQKKLWITMRNCLKHQIILSFVTVQKNMIYGKEQKQFQWKQYKTNKIVLIIRQKKIKLILNGIQQKALCIDHSFSKIQQLVLCDREVGIGSTVSQLFEFKMIRYKIFEQNQEQIINLLQNQNIQGMFGKNKEPVEIFNCRQVFQDSFIKFMEVLGDLDLFFLILSHVIRRINDFEQLLSMIRQILALMGQFVIYKKVQKVDLSKEMKQQRRNSVLCLCWLSANLKKSAYLILELMRFINIRGSKQVQQHIKFLCNFAFWKQFSFSEQKILLFRIRQLLKQAIKQQLKPVNTMMYCRRLLFQMILFYKDSCILMSDRDDCLKFHKLFLQTIYEHIKDLIQANKKKDKYYLVQIFKFFKFLIKLIACTLNQKLSSDIFDITFAIQLTQFLKLLSKLLLQYKQKKLITFNDIDLGLEGLLNFQDKGFIPLSINEQDSQQQRFNIFLTFMISQSKSLITQFQVQTVYLQQSKTKIYPIYQDDCINCSEDKIKYNLMSFNIYLHMLNQKSWSYLLFTMPVNQYNQDLLQMIWKICFIYHIEFQSLKKQRLIKMMQSTPLPKSSTYLFKILQLFLTTKYLRNANGCLLFKSLNKPQLKSGILKILQDNLDKICESDIQTQTQCSIENISLSHSVQSQPKQFAETILYQCLFYLDILKYDDCFALIQKLAKKKNYNHFKIVIYHIVIRSLVQSTKTILQVKKNQNAKINNSFISVKSEIQQLKKVQTQSTIFQSHNPGSKIQSSNEQKLNKPDAQMLNLQIINQAINFYVKNLDAKILKDHLKIQDQEQAKVYLQNYQINIEGILNTISLSKQPNFKSFYFQKYIGFIQILLINFSKYLIAKRLRFQDQVNKEIDEAIFVKNKRNKFMYKTIALDLIKQSTIFFLEYSADRRKEIYQIQKIWLDIQEKNRFFWNIFISTEKYYSLSSITTGLSERIILQITNKKPKLKLPTMGKSQSGLYSISLLSEKYGQDQTQQSQSTFFQQSSLFKTQEDASQQCYDQIKNIKLKCTKSKTSKLTFRTYFITNQKIFQGTIQIVNVNQLKFTQNTYISQLLYDRIIANPHERRIMEDVQKNIQIFTLELNEASTFIYKKYLFFDIGLQIVSAQRTCLFCFQTAKRRQLFCSSLKDHKQNIFNYPKIENYLEKQAKRWSLGQISNFQYLMKVNQFAGRSINDLSQYYIMPWTIAEFQTKNITRQYIMNPNNFRDLTKPMGKVFQKKWNQLLQRYTMNFQVYKTQKESSMLQPFLFGSFYSNPAIVANYLIRLNPYSTFHFHLQSKKFDHADRLFFSIVQQYNSCRNNSSDMKQLIPEFYSNPQFLINRSNYNLGSRQNSDPVNNVKLPNWANSAYQFIFKMRIFMQSPIVTKNIHKWIDLVFGKYSKLQNALKADNLFLSQIYGPNQDQIKKRKMKLGSNKKKQKQKQQKTQQDLFKQSKSNLTEFQSKIYYYKQFGQISRCAFNNQHISYALPVNIQKFSGLMQDIGACKIQASQFQDSVHCFTAKDNIGMIAIQRQVVLLQVQNNQETYKFNWKQSVSFFSDKKLTYCHLATIKQINSNNSILFYIKNDKKLCCRQIKRSRFMKSLQIKQQQELYDCQIFRELSKNVFVLAQKTFLKIIRINSDIPQFNIKKKNICGKETPICQYPVFTQHKQKIISISVNPQLNLIFSLDESYKLFILKYSLKSITMLNSFQIKPIHLNQKINQILIHPLSLIIIFTNYNRVLIFNYLGDLIGSKQITFRTNVKYFSQSQTVKKTIVQVPTSIQIFNKESSQLLLTTSYGNIWKVDLFQFLKTEFIQQRDIWMERLENKYKQKENKCRIAKVLVQRTGRHWKLLCLIQQSKGSKRLFTIKMLKNNLLTQKN